MAQNFQALGAMKANELDAFRADRDFSGKGSAR